ncbi:hypothetical protein ROZALSC1DRAFT_24022, partial [Rozella allomycis CSF55]
MRIQIKRMNEDSSHPLQVDNQATLQDLKQLIHANLQVPIPHQRIIFRGRVLRENEKLLTDFVIGIVDDTVVHLVVRASENEERENSRPESAANVTTGMNSAVPQTAVFSFTIDTDLESAPQTLSSIMNQLVGSFQNTAGGGSFIGPLAFGLGSNAPVA